MNGWVDGGRERSARVLFCSFAHLRFYALRPVHRSDLFRLFRLCTEAASLPFAFCSLLTTHYDEMLDLIFWMIYSLGLGVCVGVGVGVVVYVSVSVSVVISAAVPESIKES